VSLFPSRKVVAFGKPSRSLPNLQLRRLAPPWRCHIAASPKVHEPAIARHTIHGKFTPWPPDTLLLALSANWLLVLRRGRALSPAST
jgi:hypothetical protein